MKLTDLAETFVTAVTEFDINTASLDEIRAIQGLVYERKVVALKNQTLTREGYQQFAACFGELEQFKLKSYHDPAYPDILVINNRNGAGAVGARKLGNMWHSDSSYLAEPLPLTMLHAQQLPETGGDTLFVDMQSVYDDLPKDLYERIKHRQAVHDVRWTYKVKQDDLGESIQEIFARLEQTFPASTHPTVAVHPRTLRESLYVNPGYTTRIAGYSQEQSRALLDELFAFALTPARVFNYQWEPNDLLIWDNRSVLHCATELSRDAQRVMFRIGVNDGAFFARDAAQEHVA
ncbi:TauD/TfdA dioxygenase family protein [Pseudomonas syringae group genomosp. 3]|uniref:Taurine dioxygenase n=1 Tax=Pseudomonas syringae pv. primulae TaxID=251707 RepID=A0A3M5TSU4_9PSED|nr:TauD/TfdA family dioxygenase [Pseudomonas syringae group genomosp. 3]RMO68880.1 Taurine dioxygenase [Pseudomonas syringae pv. primulae]RMU36662.1 Taurine dioxygenase [Pseudomonas syringae pv. primulae]